MNITESLVSSTILMILVASGTNLYTSSMSALKNSRIRDGVSTFINDNLETVRSSADSFRLTSNNGMLVYTPDIDEGDASQMGLNFILENPGTLGTLSDSNGDNINDILLDTYTSDQFTGITITRTISSISGEPYLVRVTYTTTGNTKVNPEHRSEIMFPAQAWLP